MSIILPQFPVPTPLIANLIISLLNKRACAIGTSRKTITKSAESYWLTLRSIRDFVSQLYIYSDKRGLKSSVVILATIILLLSVAYIAQAYRQIAGKSSAKRTKIVRGVYND